MRIEAGILWKKMLQRKVPMISLSWLVCDRNKSMYVQIFPIKLSFRRKYKSLVGIYLHLDAEM